jgi:hypothetical protein
MHLFGVLGCNEGGDACIGGCGALIVEDNIKLVKGPSWSFWTNYTNGTNKAKVIQQAGNACKPHCVFNLTDDIGEVWQLTCFPT